MQKPKPQNIDNTKAHNCHRCGEPNSTTSIACSACGSRLSSAITNKTPQPNAPQHASSATSKVKFLPAEQSWWQRADWVGGLGAILGTVAICVVLWLILTRATDGSSLRYLAGIPTIFLVRYIVNWLFD